MAAGGQAFGAELEAVLKRRGLNQVRAAARCRLDRSCLSLFISGKRTPTHEVVERICGQLEATQRERYRLFVAAGYLPAGVQASWARLGELLAESAAGTRA